MPLYVDETWSRLVPEGSVEARYGISVREAERRGLLRATEPPEEPVMRTLTPVKEAPTPPNKQRKRPATK